MRFCQQEFGEFPRLVGRYCSYLLPKKAGGTPQILGYKTSRVTGRLRVYMCDPALFTLKFLEAELSHSSIIVINLGGAGDMFGDYSCVYRANFPGVSGRNHFTNTKFTTPITKISKSNHDPLPPSPRSSTTGRRGSPTAASRTTASAMRPARRSSRRDARTDRQ